MNKGVDAIKAGSFVLIAIFLFIFSIYFLGKEREIFSSQSNFYVIFKDVKGLSEGAPVRLGGVVIGRVSSIQFGKDSDLTVTLALNAKYLDKIRLDSRVSIETQGLLGDKYCVISRGQSEQTVPAGGFLAISADSDVTEIVGKASKVVDNSVSISSDLKELAHSLGAESGSDVKLTLKDIKTLSSDLKDIVHEVRLGSGLLHALIYDKKGSSVVNDFSQLSKNLSETSDIIKEFSLKLSGTSSTDDKSAIFKLMQTAENLRLASESLKNGEGTLGALLVDAKLYDSLIEVTDNAKRSFLLRQLIRSSLNKPE